MPHRESSNGGLRPLPSEYEFVTLDLDRVIRRARSEAGGPGPHAPVTPRRDDASPLRCDYWHGFRDPDELTYGRYVMLQDEAEAVVRGALGEYHRTAHDSCLAPEWLDILGTLFTPVRFALYGLQQVEAYLAVTAPTPCVTNAAAFATADFVRATSVVAHRTRRLQVSHPARAFAARDRQMWQELPGWQPARHAVETAVLADDFGEALTAANLVLWPALESVVYRSFGEVARANGDDLTWLLLANLAHDAERNRRWSTALARYAVRQRPANAEVFRSWADRWTPRAAEAVEPLASVIADMPRAMAASDVTEAASGAVAESLASTRDAA